MIGSGLVRLACLAPLLLAVPACVSFPPICVAATSVRIERVQWTTGEHLLVTYVPPYAKFSRSAGASVTTTPDRIEIRVLERYGRGEPQGRQQLVVSNPQRLPVVITDDVEDQEVWRPREVDGTGRD